MSLVKLSKINKSYMLGEVSFLALKDINLNVERGDFLAIIGASGSGKSTLMNIIGLLDFPTSGSYHLDNQLTSHLKEDALAVLRNNKIGFVFQSFNLLPRTSSLENVALPLIYTGIGSKQRNEMAKRALQQVGLNDKLGSHPNQLSGGQQQRVAIARSLVNNPEIILADEPTGNSDSKSSAEIMKIFESLHKLGKTIIIITHEPEIAKRAKRRILIKDGEII